MALNNTIMSLIGSTIGQNNINNGKMLFWSILVLSMIGVGILEAVYWSLADDIAAFLLPTPDTIILAATILKVYALVLPLDFAQQVFATTLRTIGKENLRFWILIIADYGVAIAGACILYWIAFCQVMGLIWGVDLAILTCFVIYLILFLQVDWQVQYDEVNKRLTKDGNEPVAHEEKAALVKDQGNNPPLI